MDGWMDWVGWDLFAGLFYEHRFAMLIMIFGQDYFATIFYSRNI